jgi:hypothetical protein
MLNFGCHCNKTKNLKKTLKSESTRAYIFCMKLIPVGHHHVCSNENHEVKICLSMGAIDFPDMYIAKTHTKNFFKKETPERELRYLL